MGAIVAGRGMQGGGCLLAGGPLVLLCVGQIVDWRGVLRMNLMHKLVDL